MTSKKHDDDPTPAREHPTHHGRKRDDEDESERRSIRPEDPEVIVEGEPEPEPKKDEPKAGDPPVVTQYLRTVSDAFAIAPPSADRTALQAATATLVNAIATAGANNRMKPNVVAVVTDNLIAFAEGQIADNLSA